MQSVLQDSNTSRMKLLGSKAIPDGIEARQSLNCLECSVHAWMLARASVTIPGCVSTALKRICSRLAVDKVEHEGSNIRDAGKVEAAQQLAIDVCLYLHHVEPFSTLEAVGPACVKPPLPGFSLRLSSAPCTHAVLDTHQYRNSRAFASCTTH
jgi:hypothetical protein